MSLCQDCYCKDRCKKYSDTDVEFCLKNFKSIALLKETLLSECQFEHVNLMIDSDGTDRESFLYLKSIESNIVDFINKGHNLYLYSSTCGNGKTSWSIRLLQAYVDQMWYKTPLKPIALFINVPKFFLQLKENISHKTEYIEHIKKWVNECDLVIWDDIGTKVGTEFEMEHLLNIIDDRVNHNKSNIYTSNISPEQLRQRVGERLHSRIINLSTSVQLQGKDKRGIVNK